MQHGEGGFEWNPSIEVPAQPAAAAEWPPVDRMLGLYTLSPQPPLLIPKLRALIAVIIHERGELRVRNRHPRNRKWLHFDRMRPHFIIEDKMRARIATEQEGAPGDLGVSQPFRQRERGRNLIRLSVLPVPG